jgi:NitT/TauT family transport system substrate-binding protein
MLDRRQALSAFAGMTGGALLSSGRAFGQAGTQSIRITHAVTSLAYLQSYVAQYKGFFKEAGLTAELVDTGGGGPDVQLVLGGRAELTVNDGAQILPALLKDQKLVCVMSLLNRSIVNATMRGETAQKLGITTATPFSEKIKKLKGLNIGVTRPGALTWQQARFNLVAAGLDPDKDATVIGIGGAPALAAALEFGKVDVIYISMPIGEKLVQEGKAITLIDNAKGEDPKLTHFLMEGLWTTPDLIASKPDLIARTVRAYARANAFVLASKAEDIAELVRPALGSLGDIVLVEGIRRVQTAVSKTGRVEAFELASTQDLLKLNGFLSRPFTLDEIFNGSFLVS